MGFMRKATLSSEERDKLPDSDFVFPNDDPSKRRYPIPDLSHARNALARVAQHGTPSEQEKVRHAVHSRYPALASEDVKKAEFVGELFKSDIEGKFYGVVAVPGLEDSQGDILSKQEIEAASHEFMRDYALSKAEHGPDLQHSGIAAGADLVENYIAPAGASLGGKQLVEGSWIQAWQITDPLLKQDINEGRFDGLSLEGAGFRTPVA